VFVQVVAVDVIVTGGSPRRLRQIQVMDRGGGIRMSTTPSTAGDRRPIATVRFSGRRKGE